jgi:hypothetical protein
MFVPCLFEVFGASLLVLACHLDFLYLYEIEDLEYINRLLSLGKSPENSLLLSKIWPDGYIAYSWHWLHEDLEIGTSRIYL